MLRIKKTHCFHCEDGTMTPPIAVKNGYFTYNLRSCLTCGAESYILVAINGDTGHNNPALKDRGIGYVEYFRPKSVA